MLNRFWLLSFPLLRRVLFITSFGLGALLQACTPAYRPPFIPPSNPSTPFAPSSSESETLPTSSARSLPPIQTETPVDLNQGLKAAPEVPVDTNPHDPDASPQAGQQKSWTTPDPAFTVLAGQHPYIFHTAQNAEIRYLMYLPDSYDSTRQWPLILYLHSSLEEGNDLDKLKERALPENLENEKDFPFIVISPQISEGYWFQYIDSLEDLLDGLEHVLPIDSHRMYLTGFSLGGYGTWAYAYRYPARFAAIAPVNGSLDLGTDFVVPSDICKMDTLPIWAFQGALDSTVNPQEQEALVHVLSKCGAEAKITVYPDAGHFLPGNLAYEDPSLYDWFLAHRQ
jgi:dienelactone hydrolase